MWSLPLIKKVHACRLLFPLIKSNAAFNLHDWFYLLTSLKFLAWFSRCIKLQRFREKLNQGTEGCFQFQQALHNIVLERCEERKVYFQSYQPFLFLMGEKYDHGSWNFHWWLALIKFLCIDFYLLIK